MPDPADQPLRLCTLCHASVQLDPSTSACPACGGVLIPDPAAATRPASQPDHRGILLPPRHAVGGIITPR